MLHYWAGMKQFKHLHAPKCTTTYRPNDAITFPTAKELHASGSSIVVEPSPNHSKVESMRGGAALVHGERKMATDIF
jgi:hypothetical protein